MYKNKSVKKGKDLESGGRLKEAVAEYEKALSTKMDEEVLWRLANLHEKMGKRAAALSRLKELIARKKLPIGVTDYEIKLKYSVLLFKHNKFEMAFEIFLELYKNNKKDPLILQYLIILSLGQRRCDVASILLKQLLELDDQNSNTFFLLGICFYESQEYHQAKKMFEEASKRSEIEDWRYIYLEGITHFLTRLYNRAVKSFSEAIQLNIDIAKALESSYQFLGRSHFKSGNLNQAINSLFQGKKALSKLYPNESFLDIEEDILALSIHSNNLDRMKSCLKKLLEAEPDAYRWNVLLDKTDEILLKMKDSKENQLNNSTSEQASTEDGYADDNSQNDTGDNPDEQIKLLNEFSGYLEHWENKDILGDVVWKLSKISSEEVFDLNKYLNGNVISKTTIEYKEKALQGKLGEKFIKLPQKDFISSSRKVVQKLNFQILKEEYNSEDVFLSQGDGIDYLTDMKGNLNGEKYVVQVRRWFSKSIGDMVIKQLADQVREKNAQQGIFITTGELSKEAMDFIEKSRNINVIQGKQLEFLLEDLIDN